MRFSGAVLLICILFHLPAYAEPARDKAGATKPTDAAAGTAEMPILKLRELAPKRKAAATAATQAASQLKKQLKLASTTATRLQKPAKKRNLTKDAADLEKARAAHAQAGELHKVWKRETDTQRAAEDELAKLIAALDVEATAAATRVKEAQEAAKKAQADAAAAKKAAAAAKRAKEKEAEPLAAASVAASDAATAAKQLATSAQKASAAAKRDAQQGKALARLGTAEALTAQRERTNGDLRASSDELSRVADALEEAKKLLAVAAVSSAGRVPGCDVRTIAWDRMPYPWSPIGVQFKLENATARVEADGWKLDIRLDHIDYAKLPGVEGELALLSLSVDARKGKVERPMQAVFAFTSVPPGSKDCAVTYHGAIVDKQIADGRVEGSHYLYTDAAGKRAKYEFNGRIFKRAAGEKPALAFDRCELTQIDWRTVAHDHVEANEKWTVFGEEGDSSVALSDVRYGDHDGDKKPDVLIEVGMMGEAWQSRDMSVAKLDAKCKLKLSAYKGTSPARSAPAGNPQRIGYGLVNKAPKAPGKPMPRGEYLVRYAAWTGRDLTDSLYSLGLAFAPFGGMDYSGFTGAVTLPDGNVVVLASSTGTGLNITAYDTKSGSFAFLKDDEDAPYTLSFTGDAALRAQLLSFARSIHNLELQGAPCLSAADWSNMKYGKTKLANGSRTQSDADYDYETRLEEVTYKDLDGDKQNEALAVIEHHSWDHAVQAEGGTGHERIKELHVFGAGPGCKPKLLGTIGFDDDLRFVPGYVWLKDSSTGILGAWSVQKGKLVLAPKTTR